MTNVDPGDRPALAPRRLAGIGLIVVAAIGSLVADLGFSDTSVAGGASGLWYLVPSVVLAALGFHLAAAGLPRVKRVVVGILAAALPLLVLLRWLVDTAQGP